MTQYHSPSFPQKQDKRRGRDRRQSNIPDINDILQDTAQSLKKYFETMTETAQRSIELQERQTEILADINNAIKGNFKCKD